MGGNLPRHFSYSDFNCSREGILNNKGVVAGKRPSSGGDPLISGFAFVGLLVFGIF